MPYRKLFLSRWAALLWAGGILWTAVDVADSSTPAPTGNVGTSATNASGANAEKDDDMALIANLMSAG